MEHLHGLGFTNRIRGEGGWELEKASTENGSDGCKPSRRDGVGGTKGIRLEENWKNLNVHQMGYKLCKGNI